MDTKVKNSEGTKKSEAALKLDYLTKKMEESIKEFTSKRKRNRRPALIFKILTTGLSAVVTILLGVKLGEMYLETMTNVALGISAMTTVIVAWSNFFDYNKLWVQYTKTVDDLNLLKNEMYYIKEGNEDINKNEVEAIRARYYSILDEAANFLHEVRSDDGNKG